DAAVRALEIILTNFTAIDHGQDNRIDDQSTPFLDEIGGESRMAMFALVEKALIGVESDDVNGCIEMIIEERVPQAQQGIHWVGRWMGLTALEAEVGFQKRPEYPVIERRGSPLIAHELLQCGSRRDFGE